MGVVTNARHEHDTYEPGRKLRFVSHDVSVYTAYKNGRDIVEKREIVGTRVYTVYKKIDIVK